MLTALAGTTFTALRNFMGLTVLPGDVFTAERTAPEKSLLLPEAAFVTSVNKDAANASFTFTFKAHNALDVIRPDKLYVCLFLPDAVVPTDPAEILAKSAAFGLTNIGGNDPILGDEIPDAEVAVGVSTVALFPPRVTAVEGVKVIPVISHPEAA